VCGLTVEEITSLASLYATNGPAFIRTLIGAEHSEQGATFFRAASMLPVLIGAWKQRGGGFARSVGVYGGGAINGLDIAELAPTTPRRGLQANHIGRWLADPAEGVHALMVYGANPVITIPNADLIRKGLGREDLFTVVHDMFITDTARFADIVLPATTQIEADDVMVSWGSPHLTYNNAAIPPLGESVSNSELFRRLAGAMGLTHSALHESDESLMQTLFAGRDITLEQLRDEGTVEVPIGPQRYQDGGFGTTDGKVHFASTKLAERGLGRLPDWEPAVEGVGSSDAMMKRFPFVLATPKVHTRFLNSSYSNLPGHGDREGGPYVELCAADAALLGLVDGDVASVTNDRASLTVPVKITQRLRPGLVAIPFGWHDAHHGGSGANALTSDTLVNYGGGVAYNDTRVQVSKV
jgi:anaerobic selenocysteine-containing dehydrogenase